MNDLDLELKYIINKGLPTAIECNDIIGVKKFLDRLLDENIYINFKYHSVKCSRFIPVIKHHPYYMLTYYTETRDILDDYPRKLKVKYFNDFNDEFIDAVQNNDIKKAKEFLNKGAHVLAEGSMGHSAMHYALGNPTMCDLLEHYDPLYKGEYKEECKRMRIKNGESSLKIYSETRALNNNLLKAIHNQDIEEAKKCLDAGVDVNADLGPYRSWVDSFLSTACLRGNFDIVKLFLDKGADIDAEHVIKSSAFFAARMKGDIKIIDLLLNYDKKKILITEERMNFLRDKLKESITNGNLEEVKKLINKGIDVSFDKYFGRDILSCAQETGNTSIIKLLEFYNNK